MMDQISCEGCKNNFRSEVLEYWCDCNQNEYFEEKMMVKICPICRRFAVKERILDGKKNIVCHECRIYWESHDFDIRYIKWGVKSFKWGKSNYKKYEDKEPAHGQIKFAFRF